MLRFKQVNEVSLQDFDNLVVKTYGRPYNFQQQDGCKERGTAYFSVPISHPYDYENNIAEEVNEDVMGVSFKVWLARDPKQPIEGQEYDFELKRFWDRNFYPSLEMVVQDLYEKGLIPAGEYQINIDW